MELRRRDLLIASGVWLILPRVAYASPSAPRRLDLKNPHTKETFNGPYRDSAGPIPDAMGDLAEFLRDFHADKVGPVSVATLDFLNDVMAAVGETKATILSAYRTKATNDMLRSRYFGVAEKSQHLLGKALDITFDGKIAKAERAALAMKRGGVGWYPNSHFIHLDSGPVRRWEVDFNGLNNMLLAPGHYRLDDPNLLAPVRPHHVPSFREMLARSHASAWRDYLARHHRMR
jgi:uncharacterized protein YcbK (DUF882 family)